MSDNRAETQGRRRQETRVCATEELRDEMIAGLKPADSMEEMYVTMIGHYNERRRAYHHLRELLLAGVGSGSLNEIQAKKLATLNRLIAEAERGFQRVLGNFQKSQRRRLAEAKRNERLKAAKPRSVRAKEQPMDPAWVSWMLGSPYTM